MFASRKTRRKPARRCLPSAVCDDVEDCSPDADKRANYGESFDSSTEPSFQKWRNTDYACAEYDSAETCNAQSDCFYYGDSESGSCDYSRIYIGSLLDEYCPTQTRALTSEERVAEFDLCPMLVATSKCSLLSTQAACEADSDCEYNLDMTDPVSSKYPCESAGAGDNTFLDLFFTHHSADFYLADGFCQKTYYEQSACDADDACEWDDDSSSPCGWSTDAIGAVFSGHPHLLRSYAVSQTCETIETEALCGVADDRDKCEWLEASSGDEAGCHAIPTRPPNNCRASATPSRPLCRASTTPTSCARPRASTSSTSTPARARSKVVRFSAEP